MNAMIFSRWQFGITTVYHFFFAPLTIGLGILLAIMETRYLLTGDDTYKRMTKFWGKLFLINFVMGVVTGLVQEFQFGLNWSEYSRYVGDIFGAPLAIETLAAFFLESVFLGAWIFGWDKLSPRVHAACIWLVALGSILSAVWILIANSFMHEPVGYIARNNRLEMTSFSEIVFNPHAGLQILHVVFAAMVTAAFFVLGISAYHRLRNNPDVGFWQKSFRLAALYAVVGIVLTIGIGHPQGQYMVRHQPMKMAAAEAQWTSEDPAALSLFSLIDEKEGRNTFSIQIPYMLSLLAYNRPSGEVKGIHELQAEFEKEHGPGDYVPPVHICFWSFRLMVGAGMAMLLLAMLAAYYTFKKSIPLERWFLTLLIPCIALPYLANSTGWLLTEMGRQPWIVYGLMKTSEAASKAVSSGEALFSLIAFTLLYGVLMAVDFYLLRKFAVAGSAKE
ncbi:MAG TPA: cytochrome ubiquinol oxidase subunit I [Verrucomicrobia bacterium]|nr:MAG: cytochrome D ubiquinol oxidase subunit I [Lentisphaerae bacterium GWF2_57_35]HBA85312.1 cytochrome ubiquinol oxidase subunit I [Verrucomicrobiota bacterium]